MAMKYDVDSKSCAYNVSWRKYSETINGVCLWKGYGISFSLPVFFALKLITNDFCNENIILNKPYLS